MSPTGIALNWNRTWKTGKNSERLPNRPIETCQENNGRMPAYSSTSKPIIRRANCRIRSQADSNSPSGQTDQRRYSPCFTNSKNISGSGTAVWAFWVLPRQAHTTFRRVRRWKSSSASDLQELPSSGQSRRFQRASSLPP